MGEETQEEPEELGTDEEESRFRRLARKLMDRRELADDTRDLMTSFLATSDKAKSDLIRMAGREVRHYIDGLNLKQDLLDIATNYKLEIHASVHLSPIAEALADPPEDDEGSAK